MEKNLPTLMKEVGLGSSPLVSRMLGLTVDLEEDTTRKEEAENGNSKESSTSDSLAAGANKEPEMRGLGIAPLTVQVLLKGMQYPTGSKGVKVNGNSLLDKIKVKPVQEPSDENTSGSAGTEEEKSENGTNRTCTKCNRTFLRKCDYNKHMNSHAGMRKYFCYVCNKQFTRSNHVYRHLKVHEGDGQKLNGALKVKKEKNGKSRRPRPAKVSGSRVSGVKDSQARANGTKDSAVRDSRLKKSNGSTVNGAQAPNGVRPQHQCNVCHKLFNHRKVLLQHLRNHHPSHPHVCCICRKSFTTSEELAQHRRNHQRPRPHVCNVCKKPFTRSSHLKRHMKMHSENKILECNICFKRFTNSRNFQAHMDNHKKKDAQEALHNGASSPPVASRSDPLPWADLLRLPSPVDLSQDSSNDGPLDLSKTSSVPSRPAKSSSEAVLSGCGELLSKEVPRKLFLASDLSPTKSLRMNGRGFSTSSNRRSWMRKDGSSRALHKCSVCHLIFSHGGELLAHREEAHPLSKPYCCCACDISFAEVEDLEAHARAEHGETGSSV